jgi:hypothetical protein
VPACKGNRLLFLFFLTGKVDEVDLCEFFVSILKFKHNQSCTLPASGNYVEALLCQSVTLHLLHRL